MKTMIVDNSLENAKIYEELEVDRVFVDLEINGKVQRQGHLDTVISRHEMADVLKVRKALSTTQLLVRVNPIFEGSGREINQVIEFGADVVMLPMFKTAKEVQTFVELVAGRAKTCLLLETSEALVRIDDILAIDGVDEIHIGLNDLHLCLGVDFMFELLAGGIVEYLADKIKDKGIPFGIGGIARIGDGDLRAETILKEHVRLGSSAVILSRTFKGKDGLNKDEFNYHHTKLKSSFNEYKLLSQSELASNVLELKKQVQVVVDKIRA